MYFTKILYCIKTTCRSKILEHGFVNFEKQNMTKQNKPRNTLTFIFIFILFFLFTGNCVLPIFANVYNLLYPFIPVEGATPFLFGLHHTPTHPDKCPRSAVYINGLAWLSLPFNCIMRLMEFM